MEIPNVGINEYLIIRVNGTEERIAKRPTIAGIQKAIGCDCCDSVTLDHAKEIVMMVDDTGMIDRKPVNLKATELYHLRCKPGTPYSIHGDAVVVNDRSFE